MAVVGESYSLVCESLGSAVEESYTFVTQAFREEFESCIETTTEPGGRRAKYVTIKMQFCSGQDFEAGTPVRVQRGKWVPIGALQRAKVDVEFEESLKKTLFFEKQIQIMQDSGPWTCCKCQEPAVSISGKPQFRLDREPALLWDLTCLPVCDRRGCILHARQLQDKILHASLKLVGGGVEYYPRERCGCCGIPEDDGIMYQKCGRCRTTYYCSKDCQIKGWKKGGHKRLCKKPPKIRGIKEFLKRC